MDLASYSAPQLRALDLMKGAFQQVASRDGLVTPRCEAQVQQAVDLLRCSRADPALLKSAEFLSCAMFEMGGFLRQGRVNAYVSKAVRVRKVLHSIGI
jgi:hypothetical protein